MKKILIVDLDGPVLDGRIRHYQCYSDILIKNGYKPLSIEKYWQLKRGKCNLRRILVKTDAEELYDLFLKRWLSHIEKKKYLTLDKLQFGAKDTLKNFKRDGFELALVTMRNNKNNLYWQLDKLKLTKYFKKIIVVGSKNGLNAKFEPVRQYLKDSSVDKIFWIGDTEADILAANKLGIKIVIVENGLRTREYLKFMGQKFIFESLTIY